jgi:hypothetical protein
VFIGADWKDDDQPAALVQKTQTMIQVSSYLCVDLSLPMCVHGRLTVVVFLVSIIIRRHGVRRP